MNEHLGHAIIAAVTMSAIVTPILVLTIERRLRSVISLHSERISWMNQQISDLRGKLERNGSTVEISVKGETYNREQVMAMISQINDAVRDGSRIQITKG